MKRALWIIPAIILVLCGLFAAGVLIPAPGPTQETFVEIAPGMRSREIAALLSSRGVIRSQYLFEAWRALRGGRLEAGEYRFTHRANLAEVYSRLRRGDVYFHVVTVPAGYNIFDIAQTFQNAGLDSKHTMLAAMRQDRTLVADLDPNADTLEGYLFPDTYHFQKMETPKQMLATMVRRFRQATAPLGIHGDYHRIITMASLVEKETPIASDRPLVASVFSNRLARGMPLMTDPAVIYAALLEDRYRGAIYQSDLDSDSPYNTYRHKGLPPGPICSPGMDSIKAALHPAKTDYLYFVADPAQPGHSRFSATLAQHDRNVVAYRRALKGTGTRP